MADGGPIHAADGQALRREAGFTLIEAVVALAVFALAALALLRLNTDNVRALQVVETRAFARIVAENTLAVALAEPNAARRGVENGVESLAGRDWAWTRAIVQTPDPDIDRITVTVREDGRDRVAAELTGFRGRQ